MMRSAAIRSDSGFTLFTVIMVMMITSMFAVGAYAAAMGDMPIARKDQDRKRAYEAAQAGVDWFLSELRADPDIWQNCATDTTKPWSLENSAGPHLWETYETDTTGAVPARFRVEIMNNGATACSTAKPFDVLDDQGRLWIRSTGAANGKVRSILVSMQEQSEFLKYLYFSNWESQDPQLANASGLWPAGDNRNQCDYTRETRDTQSAPVNQLSQVICVTPPFMAGDTIAGSIHTNDESFYVCGGTFGRSGKGDVMEVARPDVSSNMWNARSGPGWRSYTGYYANSQNNAYNCGNGSGTITTADTTIKPGQVLQLPPNNVKLQKRAESSSTKYKVFDSGQVCLRLEGSNYSYQELKSVSNPQGHTAWGTVDPTLTGNARAQAPREILCDGTWQGPVGLPTGGIIFVKNSAAGPCVPRYGHNSTTSYTSSPTCGDVAVSGTYSSPLTIGAENDIIVTANLEKSGSNAPVGLIANNYVRVYRPFVGDPYRYENQETSVESGNGQSSTKFCGRRGHNVWTAPDSHSWLWHNHWVGDPPRNEPGCENAVEVRESNPWACANSWYADAPSGYGVGCPIWQGTNLNYVPKSLPCKTLAADVGLGYEGRMAQKPGFVPVTRIDAAILSMQHTFQLDNMLCDAVKKPDGSRAALEFNGAISTYYAAQLAGKVVIPVFGWTWEAGYMIRNWTYDESLKTKQPPFFIAPLNSDGRWIVNRRTEQIPTPVAAPAIP